jgi:hypothetical protein
MFFFIIVGPNGMIIIPFWKATDPKNWSSLIWEKWYS